MDTSCIYVPDIMYTVSYNLTNWAQVPGTLSLPLVIRLVALAQRYTGNVMAD
jgi:hypothetical protein